MKFCKKYQEFMQKLPEELPAVGCQKLKKILKKCGGPDIKSRALEKVNNGVSSGKPLCICPSQCSVCDGIFFSRLLEELSAIVNYFNERARKLLELHLASGFQKYVVWFKTKGGKNNETLVRDGKDLVMYAMINAIAIRKILKKYNKIHCSTKQGQAFKTQAQRLNIEILQSPWLYELVSFHINLNESKGTTSATPELSDGFSLNFENDKPSLSCSFFDSIKLDIELTCSICLETVFDAVSLTCGHIFCYMCACSSASVSIVDGLKAANQAAKCPLCREAGVYRGAVRLNELNTLIRRSCPELWQGRLHSERVERVKLAKEHWEAQCRAFMGV